MKSVWDTCIFYLLSDQCLADLQAYQNGKQMFSTHIQEFDNDVIEVDGHYEFKRHIVAAKSADFAAIKNEFLNQLIANLNKR